MQTQLELNAEQKRVINEISERLAESQAAYLRTERECLTKFTEVVGYDSPADARQYVIEFLHHDDLGGQIMFFRKEEWSEELTLLALKHLHERANDEIQTRLDKWYS